MPTMAQESANITTLGYSDPQALSPNLCKPDLWRKGPIRKVLHYLPVFSIGNQNAVTAWDEVEIMMMARRRMILMAKEV